MAESTTQIQTQKSEPASNQEVQTGFGSMKGNSVDASSASAISDAEGSTSEAINLLKNFSKSAGSVSNNDDPEEKLKLLQKLKEAGVEIAEIRANATIRDLEVLLDLWSKFSRGEKPGGGSFNLLDTKDIDNPTYYFDEGNNSWYLLVWITPFGGSMIRTSATFRRNGGLIYSATSLHIIENNAIKTEQQTTSEGPATDLPQNSENVSSNLDPAMNQSSGSIAESTDPDQIQAGDKTIESAEPDNGQTAKMESGEASTDDTKTNLPDENLKLIEEQPVIEEKPTDILVEEVPTHKWNSSGLKFSRRDGQPLSYGEVQHYIEEQKKLGNQEYIDKFPKHVEGKDAAGTAPTFEIDKSKYKYYALSYDPKWGIKEEPPVDNYYGFAVNSSAIVRLKSSDGSPFNGIRLHTTPIPSDSDYVNKTGNAAKIYLPGVKLIILNKGNDNNKGWVYVQMPDGKKGWIEEHWLVPVDENYGTDYTLHYVTPGETIEQILREIPGLVRDIGHDNRAFAYTIWLMNKDNPGVYFDMDKYDESRSDFLKNGIDPWYAELRAMYQSMELQSGAVIRVPTKDAMEDMIEQGLVPTRPELMNLAIKGARIIEGLLIGIPTGIALQAADTVTGLWDLIKSIFTGEILDMLVELFDALSNMSWDDFKNLMLSMIGIDPTEFKSKWEGTNITVLDRYIYFGEIIGRIIFEIVLAVFTGGAALAKFLGKIPALTKIVKALEKVDDIIPSNPFKKAENVTPVIVKTEQAVETLLAPYKKLRTKLDEVKSKIGNTNYTKFEGLLKQLPDSVLKKLDENPDLLEAFAKRSLDDPDFFAAVQKGDLSKLDELKIPLKKGILKGTLEGLTIDEKQVVQDLLDSGKNVEIIPRSTSKTADFIVDGVKTELKTLMNSNVNTAITRIQDAFKQGEAVILDARKTTFTRSQLDEIINRAKGTYPDKMLPGKVEIWTVDGIFTF